MVLILSRNGKDELLKSRDGAPETELTNMVETVG